MKELKFSYNWNNKLDCKVFTTLRLSSKYEVGDLVEVKLNSLYKFNAIIIGKKVIKMEKINDYIAYLDTGYDTDECRGILKKMYKDVDWTTQNLYYYLVKRTD